jgi:hypothetical protein
MIYKLIKNTVTQELVNIKLTIDNGKEHFIPLDETNTDYQEYLQWVAEGNTPEPADEV